MSVEIRPMRVADLAAVMCLVQQTEGLAFKYWETEEVLARALARNSDLAQVAILHGEIVGSVFIGEGLMTMVHHLAIAPHARKQNLGTRLVQAGLRTLYRIENASRRVYVTTVPDNSGAQTFWNKFGCTLQAKGDLVLYTLDLGDQEWLAREATKAQGKNRA